MKNGNDNGWLQKVLERIEDHMGYVRRFMADSGKRWEANERRWETHEKRWEASEKRWQANEDRWQANHRILVHILDEIRQIKRK